MKKNNKSRKGFTIVELVIVIAVIAILAGVLIPTFSNVVDKANKSAALQEVKGAYSATIADELSTPDTADVVYNTAIVVEHENYKFNIAANGEITDAASTADAGYKVEGGKLVPATNSDPVNPNPDGGNG